MLTNQAIESVPAITSQKPTTRETWAKYGA